MKVFPLISFLFASGLLCETQEIRKSSSSLRNYSVLGAAVTEVVKSATSGRVTATNLITTGTSDEPRKFIDVLLLKLSINPMNAFRLLTSPKIVALKSLRRRSSVFVIESFQEFTEIYKNIKPNVFKFSGLYLIVLVSGEIPEIEQIFKLLWKLQIYNSDVMFQDENGTVHVETFMPFTAGQCNDIKPVLINQFQNGKFLNEEETFFKDKMRNLHRCSVRVAISNNTKPFITSRKAADGNYKFSGRDINLIRMISETLNFSINYTFIGKTGFFYGNSSSEGPLKALLDGEADLTVSDWWLKSNRLVHFDSSTPYFSDSIIFVVPPGREWSSWQKLVFAFSSLVWILVLTIFFVGFLVISIVRLCSKAVQNFVFGSKVTTPNLNIITAFIGGSQKILPKRNFARFLLMIFLMYSLVMRTLYQGSFYNLLQDEKRFQSAQTVDKLIEEDFSFYSTPGNLEIFESSEVLKNR